MYPKEVYGCFWRTILFLMPKTGMTMMPILSYWPLKKAIVSDEMTNKENVDKIRDILRL